MCTIFFSFLQAICPNDEDDEILSSTDVCRVVHEKLSEIGMSRLVGKGVLEDEIVSEVGFSADFIKSLKSFIEDSTKLTEEAFINDISQILKKFGQRISGITRRQLEVFMVLFLKFDLISDFCNLFFLRSHSCLLSFVIALIITLCELVLTPLICLS